jgi:hypothetical protein
MTILHTKFIVHWTGKDFHILNKPLNDNLRVKYIQRLIDTLENGFFMKVGTEKIYDLDGQWIQASISRICFTEIKLSLAKNHSQLYGNLGIGVDREFVLKRYGNPVFYVMNGNYSNVLVCARKVIDCLEKKDKAISKEFQTLLGYFKNMNEQNSDELKYYDELEWRITHLIRLETENYLTVQDRANYIYRVKISKDDIKVIIFPDEKTKVKAFNSSRFVALIDKPICVTISDCENF